MAEILHFSDFLGRAMEHFDDDSGNLAGMFFHNSVMVTDHSFMEVTLTKIIAFGY